LQQNHTKCIQLISGRKVNVAEKCENNPRMQQNNPRMQHTDLKLFAPNFHKMYPTVQVAEKCENNPRMQHYIVYN